jgi:branched-chain amino acid transport system substrate-binding protein
MRTSIWSAIILGAMVATAPALAQDKNVKIGVLTDMSSLLSDITGPNLVMATKMAVEDSGLLEKGWNIQVISADHQNKPDIGVGIASKWFEVEKVDVISDTPNSGVAVAVTNIVKERNGIHLTIAATTDITGKACTPNTLSIAVDTYMLSYGTGKALTKLGGDTWFFLAADYVFGRTLVRDATDVIHANGGKVLGTVSHPLNTTDFSSFLLQAQASKAKIIGLGSAGGDTANAILQASEFGIIQGGQKLAAMLFFINDAHALGLAKAQGLTFTNSFYWDANDDTRAFAKRFQDRANKRQMTSMTQAALYASTLHYLKALEVLGGNPQDGAKVVAKMKELPAVDKLFGDAPFRADGRRMVRAYLYEVKKPEESKSEWDLFKKVADIPAEEAAVPLSKSECPLVSK